MDKYDPRLGQNVDTQNNVWMLLVPLFSLP